ncbi:MAG: Crp/Fnr family transcriptional regulator [Pseudomonadota bacterium]
MAARLLAGAPLFRGLPAPMIDRLAAACDLTDTAKGQMLFQQGDACDRLYVLVEGSATVSITSEDGRELIVNVFHPGSSFGEIGLIDGLPRTATCTMRSAGRIISLPRAAFLEALADPEAGRAVMVELCRMLRSATERLEHLALHPLRARVAHALLGHATPGSPPIFALTQQELAQIAGGARPRVNQVLRDLERAGMITRTARQIALDDTQALHLLATHPEES